MSLLYPFVAFARQTRTVQGAGNMSGSDAPLSEQLKTEIEAIAFKSSVDLREYAAQVDSELLVLEEQLIQKYLSVGPEVASLHKQITACDAILQRMEAILSNFHKDLGTISSEIQDLQTKSAIMNKRLQNRQSVRSEMSQFLSDMAIPELLIRHILVTPVTEQEFLEHLHELDHKISFSREQSMAEYRSFENVNTLLRKLKIKAVTKIREYLLQKIYALRKPLTNYQIPQNQMLKYRFYNEFLLAHDRETAAEIRTEYVNTMSKVYYSYFKAYCSKLNKLQWDTSVEKDMLLGKRLDEQGTQSNTGTSVMGAIGFSAMNTTSNTTSVASSGALPSGGVARLGLFGLGDRSQRVLSRSNLEAPIILPHVAAKADVKYPVEVLFRSVQFALLDTACREYFFLSDFFLLSPGSGHPSPSQTKPIQSRAQSGAALAALFEQVMGRTLAMLHKQIDTRLIPVASHDALGMLICLQLLHAFLRLARERGVPVMDQFWTTIIETFWVRVTDRLDSHIASLQHDFDVTSFTNGARALANSTAGCGGGSNLPARAYALIRPHPVARRYAELAASLHSIGHGFPGTPLLPDADNLANRTSPKDSHSTAELSPSYSDFVLTSPHSSPCSGGHPSVVNSDSIAADSASVTAASAVAPPLDARILSRLAQLQTQFEMVLALLADSFPRQRLKCVFLINNYDLVISVLTERGAGDSPEVMRCREAAAKYTSQFIAEALNPYFGSLISFVREVEARQAGITSVHNSDQSEALATARNEEARVTRIIKGFNIDWKNSIEKIHGEIMTEFAHFTLGTDIFQTLLAQLVQHYHRFQQVMTQSPYKTMPVRNQLVNIHHIMNEIKKCKTSF
ncbi:hypothetical protein P879_07403 [Paragonimus westermani]|uniref:Vacuolar protein sorting-associated protein 52 homolog n=1 Tax=Paragonimus westermani TaxID=34504 RepID=A0A8T0D3C0_9TREM|nr:hypothetical protein P879_07403 [Paragonimus westermani]